MANNHPHQSRSRRTLPQQLSRCFEPADATDSHTNTRTLLDLRRRTCRAPHAVCGKETAMDPVVVIHQQGRQSLRLVLSEPIVVGRDCEGLLLADPQVSRRHLELRPQDGQVLCTDLGSTNGTFIDGDRLTEPAQIDARALLTLGDTTIRVDQQAFASSPGDAGRATTVSLVDGVDLRATSIDLVADQVASTGWQPRSDAGETVTILFSDIELSTERASALGDDRWFELLDHHNQVFRQEVARAGGREIKNRGDGFMLTFPSVRRALGFAVVVQRRLTAEEAADPDSIVRVRMGMHTGEAISDSSGDLFGWHVIKAARVANLASGGQIMVSSIVKEIASSNHDVRFGAGTEVELKGLDDTHLVFEVLWDS
ncbi:MAG: adenylate/guanylate cyclase domain-containing protein [Actinomycetia bacterium]|nr:adenylate/guanylate cyclase domain-containing protein [Actinomycetes bacterium]